MGTRSITYDTNNFKTQWRCNLYVSTLTRWIVLLVVPFVLLVFLRIPFFVIFPGWFVCAGILFGSIALGALARVGNSRICTTTFADEGIRDVTPDSDKLWNWREIRKIEFSKGDIYFFTGLGGFFIPASAFENEKAAQEYFWEASSMWKSAKNPKSIEQMHSCPTCGTHLRDRLLLNKKDDDVIVVESDKSPFPVEKVAEPKPMGPTLKDIEDEEEAAWKKIEEEHKRQMESEKAAEKTD